MTTRLHCLHGFLGQPQDWSELELSAPVRAWNLEDELLADDLWTAGHRLNARVAGEPGKRVLLGYSLGGRLAMHALVAKPELWAGAILVSSHPGLPSMPEREARRASDERWARRFESESWPELMDLWDAQAVFSDSLPRGPRESQHSRAALAMMLRGWSLGAQEWLEPSLAALRIPVLWLAGERDEKFMRLARRPAGLSPSFEFQPIRGAGHRAPWDLPEDFRREVERFLHKIDIQLECRK